MTEERKVSWTVFAWAMGITLVIFGYMFTKLSSQDAEIAAIASRSNTINVQLSQIQTDIQWIKLKIEREGQ